MLTAGGVGEQRNQAVQWRDLVTGCGLSHSLCLLWISKGACGRRKQLQLHAKQQRGSLKSATLPPPRLDMGQQGQSARRGLRGRAPLKLQLRYCCSNRLSRRLACMPQRLPRPWLGRGLQAGGVERCRPGVAFRASWAGLLPALRPPAMGPALGPGSAGWGRSQASLGTAPWVACQHAARTQAKSRGFMSAGDAPQKHGPACCRLHTGELCLRSSQFGHRD